MQHRRLGRLGLTVPAIGFGCASLSSAYGPSVDDESVAVIHHAIDIGVNLLDTSDAYGNGHNETLVGRAIEGRRHEVILCSKFGNKRGTDGARLGADGRPEHVIASCDASLRRLGVDVIDLYYQHRVDPTVPIEDTFGAVKRLIEAGKVRFAGMCEAGAQTIRRAHAVQPITALESEYSLWTRDMETEILPTCRELGIGFVAYSPLGRGFLAATIRSPEDLHPGERRHEHPRFFPENIARNVGLLNVLEAVAGEVEATPAQVALAWLLSRGDDVVPIPATRRASRVDENARAADVSLSAEQCARLEAVFRPGVTAGTRYPEKQLGNMGL
ncbi:MAG: aldo/keto reductase [Ectothiorhodospiraceae bacterium]|nr:aldo/keto reductase [Ectothiorhodospiraceae bacterium]